MWRVNLYFGYLVAGSNNRQYSYSLLIIGQLG
jgi:hypothetical protein